MYRRAIIAGGMIALAAIASAAEQSTRALPKFELAVLPPFSSTGIEHRRAGEYTSDSPPFRLVITAAMTRQYGRFGPASAKQSDSHGFSVTVYATFSKKVAAACASAKDDYQTGIDKGPGLEIPEATAYMVARLRRKQFSWGDAVTFLSQYTQDNALYAPNNGLLRYEVWGSPPIANIQ